jgi:hypothetical protein
MWPTTCSDCTRGVAAKQQGHNVHPLLLCPADIYISVFLDRLLVRCCIGTSTTALVSCKCACHSKVIYIIEESHAWVPAAAGGGRAQLPLRCGGRWRSPSKLVTWWQVAQQKRYNQCEHSSVLLQVLYTYVTWVDDDGIGQWCVLLFRLLLMDPDPLPRRSQLISEIGLEERINAAFKKAQAAQAGCRLSKCDLQAVQQHCNQLRRPQPLGLP